MAEKLRIFVSATHDLEAERAVIGRTLAELPVQVGAEIRRCPSTGTGYDHLFELISNVDRVYFLLGRDITAPAGAEWQLAVRLERPIVPLRLGGRRTQAGREFLRSTPVRWRLFRDDHHLAQLVGLDLIDVLLHPENRYGLKLPEVEALHRRRAEIARGLVDAAPEPGGAEGGGVILDPEHSQAIDSAS